ncbi:MAG: GHMP kinase [bacterium]|nr:GHMP kinase [bacterium]
MIITRTPFRISFAGGGSDIKDYYQEYGGAVLSVTIDKYVYLSMHPYFDENAYLLKYLKTEQCNDVEEIQHHIIKDVFKKYNIKGVDFNSSADIPAGTGLASSSAFTVGLVNLCNAFTGKYMDKEEIAELACEIEIEDLNEPIGKQDQYACSCGGLNYIEFQKNGNVDVEKLYLSNDSYKKLENNLLMFYTGISRKTGSILTEQKSNIPNKAKTLHKMVQLAKDLKKELLNGNISAAGTLLNQGWCYKKELASKISSSELDDIYNTAIQNGALGGKLLGAGGGGFFLFYVEDDYKDKVRKALLNLKEINFKFDNKGTNIVYYNKVELYRSFA